MNIFDVMTSYARRELSNVFSDIGSELLYVIPKKDWSVKWDGTYLTNSLNEQKLLKAEVCFRKKSKIAKGKIIHFGCRHLYLPDMYKVVSKSNRIVFTWFHGTDDDVEFIKALPEASKHAVYVHTSCSISRDNLIRWDIPESKIKVIPLGVDLDLFKPVNLVEKETRRNKLVIPKGKLVLGSFQKDGEGHDDGLLPKLIKGPDILCDTCIAVNRHFPVHVLLVGPARGYVKKRLEQAQISYSHFYLEDFLDVAWYYPIADIVLVTSRAEGGPKALLEGMASGVPVVSTKVGMSVDLIRHGDNGMLAEIEDTSSLAESCKQLHVDRQLNESIVRAGLKTVADYTWEIISKRYYDEMYKGLLK